MVVYSFPCIAGRTVKSQRKSNSPYMMFLTQITRPKSNDDRYVISLMTPFIHPIITTGIYETVEVFPFGHLPEPAVAKQFCDVQYPAPI